MRDQALRILQAGEQVKIHSAMLLQLMADMRVKFEGPTKIVTPNEPDINSESDLYSFIEQALQHAGEVRTTLPLGYWRGVITNAISKYKFLQLKGRFATLAYDGASKNDSRLQAFINLVVDQPQPVDVIALKQFIWQIKRKLNGMKVSYHLMPILWGPTGSGKSEAVRRLLQPLAGYVLHGLSLDKLGDDRYYRQYAEHLACFFDEMSKVEKASVESIKQVITADELTGRLLYSNSYKNYPQLCTFIGTSNEGPSDLIKDSTSMRRFHYMKSPDRMDWQAVNNFDVLAMWKSVNEGEEPTWMTTFAKEFAVRQEEARTKSPLELFLDEGFLAYSEGGETFESGAAYQVFKEYASESGYHYAITKQSFNKHLTEKFGFKRVLEGEAEYTARASKFPTYHGRLVPRAGVIQTKNLK